MRLEEFKHLSLEGMTFLNVNNVHEWIGKRIHYFSKQYRGNADAEGIAVIKAVDLSKKYNVLTVEEEYESGTLKYAFVGWDNDLCIGDEDRPVVVKEYED